MLRMETAPNDMFCGGCGKVIKRGQKISLDGLCYDCKREQMGKLKYFKEDIGRLRKPNI